MDGRKLGDRKTFSGQAPRWAPEPQYLVAGFDDFHRRSPILVHEQTLRLRHLHAFAADARPSVACDNPGIDNLSVFSANHSPALFQDRDKPVTDFSQVVKQFSRAHFRAVTME